MKEIKILAPTGILGYGFPKAFFDKGMEEKPDAIVVDAGSTDAGPHKLGACKSIVSDEAYMRDLELIINAGAENDIPVVIGSAGGAGARPHVEHTTDIIKAIIRKYGLKKLKTAVVWADIEKDLVMEKMSQGKVYPLNRGVPELTSVRLERTNAIVAQMGYEPILKALNMGARLIICGRAYDPSPFAAVAEFYGLPLAFGFHAGKILECAALCAVPGTTKDCIMGIIREDGFIIYPLSENRRCTPLSVAAHTFYEKEHPYLLHGPGIVMDLKDCEFNALDDKRVMVTGSRLLTSKPYRIKLEGACQAAYRTFTVAGIRDPLMIARLKEIEKSTEEKVREYYADIFSGDYQINFINYGLDGVLGENEPVKAIPHEVGIVFEAIADSQEKADAICSMLRSTLLHWDYEGRKSTAGNLAFTFAPSDISFGPVYEFSVYHLMELDEDEITGLFPVEFIDWKS